MKPTKASVVLVIVFGVTVLSFVAVRLLVANGMAVPASPTNLLVTLAAIALILLGLTIPIWRYKASLTQYTKGPRPKRVDPFYAVRVVLLAKASAITGSGFVGWHLGAMIAQLSLPVSFTAALLQNSFGLVASVVLTVAAIVSEQICRLPDEPKDNQTDQMVSN
jgi:hypothetical protein